MQITRAPYHEAVNRLKQISFETKKKKKSSTARQYQVVITVDGPQPWLYYSFILAPVVVVHRLPLLLFPFLASRWP